MPELSQDFKSQTFGVKIQKTEVVVDSIASDFSEESSNYDFIISDMFISSRNGNDRYGTTIKWVTPQEDILFYGWKLISLSFPGNWYGQVGQWTMEDLFGERIVMSTTRQMGYSDNNNARRMIKESIEGAIRFAEEYHSVAYYEMITDEDATLLKSSRQESNFNGIITRGGYIRGGEFIYDRNTVRLRTFKELILATVEYIEKYEKVCKALSLGNDERTLKFMHNINRAFRKRIKENYSFGIVGLSDDE